MRIQLVDKIWTSLSGGMTRLQGRVVCQQCGTRSRDFLVFLWAVATVLMSGFGLWMIWR